MAPVSILIHRTSLSKTVDAVNEAFFFEKTIPATDRREVARWIAARHDLPGAYGKLFGGFPSERESGIRVFTGERIASASARHILGEESCRALQLLASRDPKANAALAQATAWLIDRVSQAGIDSPSRNNAGSYCCGKCTVGLWRNVVAGGLDCQSERLELGLKRLRARRDGKGGWKAFPFWYTLLALTEMDHPDARNELVYAADRIKAEAQRSWGRSPYSHRRKVVARRAMEALASSRGRSDRFPQDHRVDGSPAPSVRRSRRRRSGSRRSG